MKPVRSCPICPECGGKKFKRLPEKNNVAVKCLSCQKIIRI